MRRTFTLALGLCFCLTLGACGPPFGSYGNPTLPTSERSYGSLPSDTLARPTNIVSIVPTIQSTTVETIQVDTDILTFLQNDDRFSTLVTALEEANLQEALLASGAAETLFAPTNEAFAALPEGALDQLLAAPDDLSNILLYHRAAGPLAPSQVAALQTIGTLQGDSINVALDDDNLVFNGNAQLLGPVVQAANGIILVIDQVLIPPE
ncbi:MAG: fasciclin domain-containing protein [Chloroflexales bacterium]|nr:fasciclin domain-containing protein [Chloroflexales bacterium]